MSKTITVDVVSDVVCPWCYIGKRKLEAALRDMPDVEVRWRPYQLDPTIPAGGLDRKAYMDKKFGAERYKEIAARIAVAGASEGIAFAFEKIAVSPNTLDAHRLIRWAASAGKQGEVKERLMQLYFTQGGDIGDRAVLVAVAEAAGMDGATVAKLLDDGSDIDAVREEIAMAQQMGVTGVPFFIFNGKVAVSGAQPPEVLRDALRQSMAAADLEGNRR